MDFLSKRKKQQFYLCVYHVLCKTRIEVDLHKGCKLDRVRLKTNSSKTQLLNFLIITHNHKCITNLARWQSYFLRVATLFKRKLFSYKDLFALLHFPSHDLSTLSLSLSLSLFSRYHTHTQTHTHTNTHTQTLFFFLSLSNSLDIFVGHIGSLVFDQFNNNNDIRFSQSSRLTGSRVTSYKWTFKRTKKN